MVPGPNMEEVLAGVVDRLRAGAFPPGDGTDADEVLAVLKDLTARLFAPGLVDAERLRIAERSTKAIYVHTHMDEESFDSDRIRQCCVGMPAADGTSIPSCAYNVLYRERDARYTPAPRPAVTSLGKGRVALPVVG
jgi:hypothetical protein